jgi:hypothetical protein
MLHVDVPTLPEISALINNRADACVTIYLSTTPQTQHVTGSRISLGNLMRTALEQLDAVGFDKRRRAMLEDELVELGEDEAFWRLQANSLAIFSTPDSIRTYRLATAVADSVEVSDRFHLKPLLRAIAFSQHAFVLALSENAVRLVEVFADAPPVVVHIADLPKNAADATGRASINERSQGGRIQGSEGQKVLLRQFARHVDSALRPVLSGRETPLILAAVEPLASIYRITNTYQGLVPDGIAISADHATDSDLAAAAREPLDQFYAQKVEAAKDLFHMRVGQNRATTDIDLAARAATFGAIEMLLIDIDEALPGVIGRDDGKVTRASVDGPKVYDVIDEIAGRALLSGATVLAVRRDDIPEQAAVAAILRYPM